MREFECLALDLCFVRGYKIKYHKYCKTLPNCTQKLFELRVRVPTYSNIDDFGFSWRTMRFSICAKASSHTHNNFWWIIWLEAISGTLNFEGAAAAYRTNSTYYTILTAPPCTYIYSCAANDKIDSIYTAYYYNKMMAISCTLRGLLKFIYTNRYAQTPEHCYGK